MLRRYMTAVLAVALGLAAFAPGTAKAFHIGGTLDCGSAGTFTTEGTEFLPSGFQAPVGGVRLLLDTPQVFTTLELYLDGELVFKLPGLEHAKANMVTCEQTVPTIGTFTFTGVLTGPRS